MPAEELPEGTDAIVTGAGVGARDDEGAADQGLGTGPDRDDEEDDAPSAPTQTATGTTGATAQSFASRIDGLKGQANDRARGFVEDAKARATDSIDGIVQMIQDAASEVDDKVGTQYGDYVRRAADSVASLSDGLKDKDADALFADARNLIQKSPGVAICAAAALGFVVARLARAGLEGAAAPQTGKAA